MINVSWLSTFGKYGLEAMFPGLSTFEIKKFLKKIIFLSFIIDTIGSKKPTQESKEKPKFKMCSSCVSKDETPLSDKRDEWPIGKIEIGCFNQICKLLDIDTRSKEPLMIALGGFDQTVAAGIKKKFEAKGGSGIAEEVLGKWGSSKHENNVGALKKILKDIMERNDVVLEIKKWEKLSVCHGCGARLDKPRCSQ
jgi:hypothetical protein